MLIVRLFPQFKNYKNISERETGRTGSGISLTKNARAIDAVPPGGSAFILVIYDTYVERI
jgi:hypothetical protein